MSCSSATVSRPAWPAGVLHPLSSFVLEGLQSCRCLLYWACGLYCFRAHVQLHKLQSTAASVIVYVYVTHNAWAQTSVLQLSLLGDPSSSCWGTSLGMRSRTTPS